MILSTHVIGGAATALLFPRHPVISFFAGFFSHFILDAFPHWHYRIKSRHHETKNYMEDFYDFDAKFVRDVIMTGTDTFLGFLLASTVLWNLPIDLQTVAFWGGIGGILPDLLQVVYAVLKHTPMKYLQRFHIWIHSKKRFDNDLILGLGSQLIYTLALLYVLDLVLNRTS